MSEQRVRVEVETYEHGGSRGVIRYVDLADRPENAEVLALLDRAVDELAEVTNLGRQSAAYAMLAELALQASDEEAADRVAERRGLLW